MSADLLLAATAALRDVGQGPESMVDPMAEGTRRRVMASLGERNQGNRRRLGFAVFALALSMATLSWAASTGRLKQVLRQLHVVEAAPPAQQREPAPLRPAVVERVAPEAPAIAAVAPVTMTIGKPVVVVTPEPARKAPRRRVKALAAAPPIAAAVEPPVVDGEVVAYRSAHGVHFRGGDAAAALAAWDGYLAAYPGGRFVAEAAYNRAITLVRLGRKGAARAALAPFAAGEMAGGYRRDEAAKLREALK